MPDQTYYAALHAQEAEHAHPTTCASRLFGPCPNAPLWIVFTENDRCVKRPGNRFCGPCADELVQGEPTHD